jgi:hypothetical protein
VGRLARSIVFTLAPRAAANLDTPRVHVLLQVRIVRPARERGAPVAALLASAVDGAWAEIW